MLDPGALCPPGELNAPGLRLTPLGPQHFDGVWAALADREAMRLTGTQATFTPEAVHRHLDRLAADETRADWAILAADDGRFLGEVVLNQLDADNAAMNFRIALAGGYGRGVGTAATRLVVGYGLDVVGLHRIALTVFAFNPRAVRVYEKCGFRVEGRHRDVLFWDGQWHDELSMAILAGDPRESSAAGPAVLA